MSQAANAEAFLLATSHHSQRPHTTHNQEGLSLCLSVGVGHEGLATAASVHWLFNHSPTLTLIIHHHHPRTGRKPDTSPAHRLYTPAVQMSIRGVPQLRSLLLRYSDRDGSSRAIR